MTSTTVSRRATVSGEELFIHDNDRVAELQADWLVFFQQTGNVFIMKNTQNAASTLWYT